MEHGVGIRLWKLLEKDGHKVSSIDLMSASTNPVNFDSVTPQVLNPHFK
jgi:hypothetical protein